MGILEKITKSDITDILSFAWTAFGMGYIIAITFCQIPEKNVRVVDTVLGFVLGTIIATIIGYYFGNSKKEKKE